MERPYDKDIELLMGDLNVHSYIAHHYAQEQIEFGKTAERLQEEIFGALLEMRGRQQQAITEWQGLKLRERQQLLEPLTSALEQVYEKIKDYGCTEMAIYIQNRLSNFLMDLVDFRI